MSWIYDNEPLEEVPTDAIGFTYKILIGKYNYYGLKRFHTKRKIPKGKKELALQDGRASKKKLVVKESNWKTYCSSSKEVEKLVREGVVPHRYIIDICYSLKELSYKENKLLYRHIEHEHNLNRNISAKYYREEILTW